MKDSISPEDSDTRFHLFGSMCSLQDIQDAVKKKWGDVDPETIQIEPLHFHARCLTYDQYDSTDYDDYITVSRSE